MAIDMDRAQQAADDRAGYEAAAEFDALTDGERAAIPLIDWDEVTSPNPDTAVEDAAEQEQQELLARLQPERFCPNCGTEFGFGHAEDCTTPNLEPASGYAQDTEEAMSESRKAANAFADAAGEDRAEVGIANVDWAQWLQSGATIKLTIRRWRMEATITDEDLGIDNRTPEDRAAWRRTIRLGAGYLMPKHIVDEAAKLDDQARLILKRLAFATHWGFFVPLGAADATQDRTEGWYYRRWKNETEAVVVKYKALGKRIFGDAATGDAGEWEELVAQVQRDYAIIGFQNWTRLKQSGRTDLPEVEDFIRAFVRRRVARMPSKEAVRDSWSMTYKVDFLPMAQTMASDQAAAAQILASQEAKNEMVKDIVATSRATIQTDVMQFADDMRAHMSALAYDVSTGVLRAINDNGEVPGGSVKSLRSFVKAMQDMNFWDDDTLKRQMQEVRAMLNQQTPLIDRTREVRTLMRKIGAEARLTLLELDRAPERSAREVGIPDTIVGLSTVLSMGGRAASVVRTLDTADLAREGNGRSAQDSEKAL